MTLKITTTARQIIEILVQIAHKTGNHSVEFSYSKIMKELDIGDRDYIMLCLQYLYVADYLRYIRSDGEDIRVVRITEKAIDLVEKVS